MPTPALENSKQNQVSGTESSWTIYVTIRHDNNDPKGWDYELLIVVSFFTLPANQKLNFKNWLKSKQKTVFTSLESHSYPALDMDLRKWPAQWWAKKRGTSILGAPHPPCRPHAYRLSHLTPLTACQPKQKLQGRAQKDIPLIASCAKYLTSMSSSWPNFCSTGLTSSCKALKSNSIICESLWARKMCHGLYAPW